MKMNFNIYDDLTRRKTIEGVNEGDCVEYDGLVWSVKELHTLKDKDKTFALLEDKKGNYIEAEFGKDFSAKNIIEGEKRCRNIIPRRKYL